MLRNFLASITRNGLSMAGTALAVAGLVLIISLFVMEQLGFEGGPYLGILTYLILPVIIVTGTLAMRSWSELLMFCSSCMPFISGILISLITRSTFFSRIAFTASGGCW